MADIATLGLAVDSSEVVDASRDLDRIREAAGRAERAADSFGNRTEAAGRRASAANDNVARSADKAAKAYDGYSKAATLAARAIGAVVGAAVGTALVQFADTWSDISARVGIAVGDMEAAPAVLARISQTARMTYSSLELTAEGFVRNAMVLNELGKSTQQQLDYQEALNNALVVSGARGRAAEFVQESLNRSMALGAMRGVELNNVLNYGGRIAELLAEHFNTTTGGLMKLAQEGKITGDVLYNVLTKNMETLREESASMAATMGDGMVLIRNGLMQFVGGTDQALGASEALAEGLIIVADNIGRIVTVGATAVTMYGTYYVAALGVAYVSTMTLTGALNLLRAALLRTGIGLLIVALGELVYQLLEARRAAESWADAFADLFDRSKAIVAAFGYYWESAVAQLEADWRTMLANIVDATQNSLSGILSLFGISADAISSYSAGLRKDAELAAELAATSQRLGDLAWNHGTRPRENAEVALPGSRGGARPSDAGTGRSRGGRSGRSEAEKMADAYEKLIRKGNEFISQQELEARVVGMTEQAANALRYEMEMLNQAANDNIKLTPEQTAEIKALAQNMSLAEAAAKRLKEAYEFSKDVAKGFVSDLRSGLQQGKSLFESFANAAINALDKVIDKLLNDMIDAIFEVNKAGSSATVGGGSFLGNIFSSIGKVFGFSGGGWTGGHRNQVRGVVHGEEYVVRAGPAARYRPQLEAMNANRPLPVNNNQPQHVVVEVRGTFVDDNGVIKSQVTTMGQQATQAGATVAVRQVKQALPSMIADSQARKM